jgi:hypothetical protein
MKKNKKEKKDNFYKSKKIIMYILIVALAFIFGLSIFFIDKYMQGEDNLINIADND